MLRSLTGEGMISMQGLEISRSYFNEFGMPMLAEGFSEISQYLCCGMFGSGSECLGYDDEESRDHDFEPGFMILLPGEDIVDRRTEFLLERAYAKLPKEYMGLKRSMFSPVGGSRKGVIRAEEFFYDRLGTRDGYLSVAQWLQTPEHYLLEATNGEVYFDNYGLVTEIRQRIAYLPEDIRLKKLAGKLLLMAQSGQYNFLRCLKHDEPYAAQLAVIEFVKSAISVIYLLNKRYEPFYKWAFRGLEELPVLKDVITVLKVLITTDNDGEMAEQKYYAMEGICARVIEVLQDQEITKANCGDMEKNAYSVNDMISDSNIRNANILMGVR